MAAYPHLFAVSWPVQQVLHTAFFLYVTILMNPTLKPSKKHLLYFLPSLAVFIVCVPFIYMKSADEKIGLIQAYNQWDSPSFYFIFICAFIVNLTFLGLSIYRLLLFLDTKRLKNIRHFRVVFIILINGIIADFLLFIALASQTTVLVRIDSVLIDLLVCMPFFLSIRYPHFMYNLSVEISREKYKQSQIHSLNVDSVITRLRELLELEKVYTDPELNITRVSEVLMISKHQLSEILNTKLKVDYKNFINSYRVREAKKLLIDKPDITILQIAYAVGFNSKTAFYEAFTRDTSVTPTKYRRKNLKNRKK
jgi:AraC-like DNA-binding protein